MQFATRLAHEGDVPAITTLMERAIARLQDDFLSPEQVSASRMSMGLDTQLIADRTYWLAFGGERLAGCGGWSRRATLYGGDDAAGLRDPALLDPNRDPARIRAMYTDPDFVRQGVGCIVLRLCEGAAREAGFRTARMMATMAGKPLYRACGYTVVERVDRMNPAGVAVPGAIMEKRL